jgi:superfamily II DNA/RNA helicase
VDTLIATDVAARGIDVEGISHVINFHPPGDHDAYIHRVGRTGRAGRGGIGITLVGAEDHQEMSRLARRLGLGEQLGTSGGRASNHGAPGRRGGARRSSGRRPSRRAA